MQHQIRQTLERAARTAGCDEKSYLRDLAGLVVAISQEPRMAAVIRRWQAANELEKADRAPVWCKPVNCVKELLPEADLHCRERLHRQIERHLRQILIKYEIGDDEIILGHWAVGPVIRANPANWWGVEIGRHASSEDGGAWAYDPPLKSPDDLPLVASPTFAYDRQATEEQCRQYQDVLGDAMPVRLKIAPGFDSATIVCNAYAKLRGLEELMLDTMLEPEFAHRLCRRITDARLAWLDALENAGMNATNCDQPMLCSRPFGPEPGPGGRLSLANCWCAGNSQELDQVSPASFNEFLLQYQLDIFRRFGRVAYGCCENLTHKMDLIISQIPNLRVLTCSAWTDFDRLVDTVGARYTIMWRQKATDVVFAADAESLRQPLLDKCRRLRHSHYQIVLRELETLNGNLRRLHEWTRIAIDCAGAA